MFQFPGFASNPYEFRVRYLHGTIRSATSPGVMPNAVTIRIVEGGFPHSEILGSKLVRSSPRLIAAYHVLHRLSAPRHPPNALKALDHSHDRCPPVARTRRSRPADFDQKDHCGSNLSVRALACRTYPIGGAVTPSLVAGARGPNSRICSLFTISNTRTATCVAGELPLTSGHRALLDRAIALVEPDGIEPTTSCLQSTRSPN